VTFSLDSQQIGGSVVMFLILWKLETHPPKCLVPQTRVLSAGYMAHCCVGRQATVGNFTVLLIHVLHVSDPAALEGSTHYAREIVDKFFLTHTKIDIIYIEPHNYKFCDLTAESRLWIAFVSKPMGLKVPSHKLFKYELSEGLAVVFEVETRLIKRYIPPHCEFGVLEVE
jgi:hypothetical protein